jgi:hypothetical protein
MPRLTPREGPHRPMGGGDETQVRRNCLRCCAPILLCCAYILGCVAPAAQAWEVFTGFQMDNRKQYLAYGGVRVALTQPAGGFTPFVQLFTLHQAFFFHSAGQLLQEELTQVIPAVGVTKSMGQLQLGALAGPALRETHEDTVLQERERSRELGYAFQLECTYWTDTDGFEGLVTYTNLDNFFFGRFRWKHPIVATEGKLSFNLGLEGLAMGNSQVQEGLVGGLLEIQWGKLVVLVKGGYQNNTTFHSGGYGGIELYVPFGEKPNVDSAGEALTPRHKVVLYK